MIKALMILALAVQWLSPTVAEIQWSGPGCLYKNSTLIACYPREGAAYTIELGSYPGLDAAYRPQPNDVFVLVRADGTQECSVLGARPLYLPTIRH